MKKIINNCQFIKNLLFVIASSLIMVFALVYFVKSITPYDGGFDSNPDYVISLFASFFLFSYTLQVLIHDLKNGNPLKAEAKLICFGVIFTLFAFYPLGVFFRGLAKGKEFDIIKIYLYVGLVSLVCLLAILVEALKYLSDKKKKN